jgi:hypothetical protein
LVSPTVTRPTLFPSTTTFAPSPARGGAFSELPNDIRTSSIASPFIHREDSWVSEAADFAGEGRTLLKMMVAVLLLGSMHLTMTMTPLLLARRCAATSAGPARLQRIGLGVPVSSGSVVTAWPAHVPFVMRVIKFHLHQRRPLSAMRNPR